MSRVYFKALYSDKSKTSDQVPETSTKEAIALDQLVSLLEEGATSSSDDEEISDNSNWRRNGGLKICFTSMPQFRKNRRLGIFLDLVQENLRKIDCQNNTIDNLSVDERRALEELQNADNIVIKQSDKGGNVVLFSVDG